MIHASPALSDICNKQTLSPSSAHGSLSTLHACHSNQSYYPRTMPGVTELATLRLAPGTAVSTPSLQAHLARAKEVLESALGIKRRFNFYQDTRDPSVLYIIGEWGSPAEHWDDFVPSAENQELLELLQDEIEGIEMYHVDVPNADVPSMEVVNLAWFTVRREDKDAFEEHWTGFGRLTNKLATHDERRGTSQRAGGWRVEKEESKHESDDEEWVMFSVDRDGQHGGTEASEISSRMKELSKECKHGHAKLVEI